MDLQNFKFIIAKHQQIIEINYLNQIFDLHNAAEFIMIQHLIKSQKLILFWNYYIAENNIIQFQLIFEETSYLEILPRDDEMPLYEDETLEQIFYDGNKMTFCFMGGMKIIVVSNAVRFVKI